MKTAITQDWLLRDSSELHRLLLLTSFLEDPSLFTLQYNARDCPEAQNRMNIQTARYHEAGELSLWKKIRLFSTDRKKFSLSDYDIVFSNSPGPLRWVKKDKYKAGRSPWQFAYVEQPHPGFWKTDGSDAEFFIQDFLKRDDLPRLRNLDFSFSAGIDLSAAPSKWTAMKLQVTYGIKAHVLPPPVHPAFVPKPEKRKWFYAELSAKTQQKIRLLNVLFPHLAVPVQVSSVSVVKTEANMVTLPVLTPPKKTDILSGSFATILLPGEESVLAALESFAMGVPVIAWKNSAAAEYIRKDTGYVLSEETPDALLAAVYAARKLPFSAHGIRKYFEENFSDRHFSQGVRNLLTLHGPPDLRQSFLNL